MNWTITSWTICIILVLIPIPEKQGQALTLK